MLRTIIIDDERRSRENLEKLLGKYCNGVDVIAKGDGVNEGRQLIQSLAPDLVFLDIRMQDGTGFDLLSQIPQSNFQVIFTTAYDQYAVRAFKFSAIDYLLKPIDLEELNSAVEKAKAIKKDSLHQEQLSQLLTQVTQFDKEDPTITISTEQSFEFLKVKEIIRVGAEGAYSRFFMQGGKQYLTSRLLKEYDALLSEYGFFRIHNSHLINLREVTRYLKGDGFIVLSDATELPVSRRKKEAFVQRFVR